MIEKITRADGTKRYRVRVGHGQPSKTFQRYEDAREYEGSVVRNRRRAKAGMEQIKPAITYDQLCDLFLESYGRRSKTWTENILGYSRKKWGRVLVRQLQPEQINPWLDGLETKSGRPLAPKTKHHILERMRTVCTMGVEWGYLDRSPVRPRAVPSPGTERLTAINPFESWAEVEQIASELGKEYAPWGQLVRFVCATGLRPGEWRRLTWANAIDRHEIRVPGTKTTASVRAIPLGTPARDALDSLGHPLRLDLPIWTTKTGRPMSKDNYDHWRKNDWKLAFVNAGVAYREPYEMRHTFATLALTAGLPIEVVSKLMGHKSIEITQRFYAKYTRTTLGLYVPLLNKIGESHGIDHEDAATPAG